MGFGSNEINKPLVTTFQRGLKVRFKLRSELRLILQINSLIVLTLESSITSEIVIRQITLSARSIIFSSKRVQPWGI